MKRPEHTVEYLRQCLVYNPRTGEFHWRARPVEHFRDKASHKRSHVCALWNGRFAGKKAGSICFAGYVEIGLDDERYLAHRLAWFYMTGEWPEQEIDHIDLIKNNNRFANLRIATSTENRCNRGLQSNNTSGIKGVSWYKAGRKWRADISVSNKYKFLGYFQTKAEAAHAYECAALKLHGEFARVS